MANEALEARFAALEAYVDRYPRHDFSLERFWDGFDGLTGDLCNVVLADNVDPTLRERYTDLLSRIDDMGYSVPNEMSVMRWDLEGGSVALEDVDGKFVLHINQVALLDMLDTDDRDGIDPVVTHVFDSADERMAYIQKRGWRLLG